MVFTIIVLAMGVIALIGYLNYILQTLEHQEISGNELVVALGEEVASNIVIQARLTKAQAELYKIKKQLNKAKIDAKVN